MIVTVTANPSIDLTFEIDRLHSGEVNRADRVRRDPAGKGINVTRALTRNNIDSVAVFPADEFQGAWLVNALSERGVTTRHTSMAAGVRHNVTFVESSGVTTKINDQGPSLSPAEVDAILGEVRTLLAAETGWVVAAGSLPAGIGSDFLTKLGQLAHEVNAEFAVDTSGSTLREVIDAGVADVLKPNLEELEEVAERSLTTVGDVVEVCHSFAGSPEQRVLVSLGEHGALLVTRARVLWAGHPPVNVVSTVGAGDCTLAGFLAAETLHRKGQSDHEDPLAEQLVNAVAWGTAAVQLPATHVPGPEHLDTASISLRTDIELHTEIKELSQWAQQH